MPIRFMEAFSIYSQNGMVSIVQDNRNHAILGIVYTSQIWE
jgi:hypothetical protein